MQLDLEKWFLSIKRNYMMNDSKHDITTKEAGNKVRNMIESVEKRMAAGEPIEYERDDNNEPKQTGR